MSPSCWMVPRRSQCHYKRTVTQTGQEMVKLKSTSGVVIYLAGTLVESGAHTQQGTPATSSGEAEIRSLTECAKATLFVKHFAETDCGMNVDTP